MLQRVFVILGLALFCALCCLSAHAFSVQELLDSRFDPYIKYETIETDHFRIHYAANLRDLARFVAPIAENVHTKVTRALKGAPLEKTNLVIIHHSDEPAIFTFAYPHNQIFLDAALPEPSVGLNEFAEWYDWVLTHEYTHTVHLDRRSSYYRGLAKIMGTADRPNDMTPLWMKEGLAVFNESTLTPKGRGGGSVYRMMTRMAVAERWLTDSRFAAPDTIANIDNKNWPWTVRPYYMGYYLTRQIQSGDTKNLVNMINASASSLPFRLDHDLKAAGVGSFDELWRATLGYMYVDGQKEIEALSKEPFTKIFYLTRTGQIYRGVAVSPLGDRILVTRDHPDFENAILQFKIKDDVVSPPEILLQRTTGTQTSFSKSGRYIAFDQTLLAKRYYQISDVFIYDLKTNKIISASPYLHIRDPDIHPDGQHLVFVNNFHGKNRLFTADTDWHNFKDILGDVGYRRISAPHFSPDGSKIVVSLHNEQTGGEDLWLVGSGEHAEKKIILADSSINMEPSWTPNGEQILFSSDKTGVYNIYSYDLATQKVRQMTHVLGGLFSPVLDPEMRWLYVIAYGARGYDLARIRYSPYLGPKAPIKIASNDSRIPSALVSEDASPTASSVIRVGPRPYSSLPDMWPQYTLPSFIFRPNSVQAGFSFGAMDPLYSHHYNLELRYDTAAQQPVGQLLYFNGTGHLAWDFSALRDVYTIPATETLYQTMHGAGALNIPVFADDTHLNLRPGVTYNFVNYDGTSQEIGPRLGLRYNTEFKQVGYSFAEAGSYFDLAASELWGLQNAPAQLTALELNYRFHQPLWGTRHALHLSATGGTFVAGTPGPNDFYTAGGQLSFPFSLGSNYLLYGYPPNQIASSTLGVGSLLYTFPIAEISRGFGTSPIFFGRLSGGLRGQAAGGKELGGTPTSFGAELHQAVLTGYVLDLDLQLGVYQGDTNFGGGTEVYFAISSNGAGATGAFRRSSDAMRSVR